MLEEFVTSAMAPVSDAGIMSIAQQLQNTAELIEVGLEVVEPNVQVPDDNCCYLFDKKDFGGDNIEMCMASNETYT